MKNLSKFKTLLRVSLLSLMMILMTGVDSFSEKNGKSKKVSDKKSEIPKPIVDETPINPRNVSKGNKDSSNLEDSTDTSKNQVKPKKKQK